jgi:inorganic phosphate transporter, PiT family
MDYLLITIALFLAFNNGANDNFKGFATVWGSDTLPYQKALLWATLATLAGSLASWLLADNLLQQFSGKGLVPAAVASKQVFIFSVACGAAFTVFAATKLGLPISTTHALIGGLIGAGLGQAGGSVNFAKLLDTFLLPLLLSPVLAASLGYALYQLTRWRQVKNDCVCLTDAQLVSTGAMQLSSHPIVVIAEPADCANLPSASRFSITHLIKQTHIASAVTICFARALNDTPKLAALMLAAHFTEAKLPLLLVGCLMAIGGVLFAQKVAHTMSQKITRLDDTQGLTANLITTGLVLMASKFGLPVSTTHVSVGAIAGVGARAGTLNWQALRTILLSWVATLPLAMGAAWLVAKLV